MEDFGIEGIYIVAPEGSDSDRTLPGTCLKPGYFGFSETHYLDVSNHDDVMGFENIIRNIGSNMADDGPTIEGYLKKYRKEKEGLKFSDLAKVSNIGNNIKITALVGENGSGKTQLMKKIEKLYKNQSSSERITISLTENNICIDIFNFDQIIVLRNDAKIGNILFDELVVDNNILSVIDTTSNKKGVESMFRDILGVDTIYGKRVKGDFVFATPDYIKGDIEFTYPQGMGSRTLPALFVLGYFAGIRLSNYEGTYSIIYKKLDEIKLILSINESAIQSGLVSYALFIKEIFYTDKGSNWYNLHNLQNGSYSNLIMIIDEIYLKILDKIDVSEKESGLISYKRYDEIEVIKQHSNNILFPTWDPVRSRQESRVEQLDNFCRKIINTSLFRHNNNGGAGLKLGSFDSNKLLGEGILSKLYELKKLFQNGPNLKDNFFDVYSRSTSWEMMDCNHRSIEGLHIDNLSSGERSIICRILSNISDKIKSENDYYIICIDEPDAFLHIQRQKKYIQILVNWISTTYPNKKFHLIIATHSPFIISDIPENNLLILEKGKDVTQGVIKAQGNSFANTTYGIISQFMGMHEEILGDFTNNILQTYIKKKKTLLRDLYDKELKDENTDNILSQLTFLDGEYQYGKIIKNIGDEFLRDHLLWLGNNNANN